MYAPLSPERRFHVCSDSDYPGKMGSDHLRLSFSDGKHG